MSRYYISAVVEGDVDAAVIRRLAQEAGLGIAEIHVKRGKANVRKRITSYNQAARHLPFVVLVDLDREYHCAPDLIADWLPHKEPRLCLRVAVRAVEAWLLADRERVARFLRVKQSRIPAAPEEIDDPKKALVDIANASSSQNLLTDLVPRPGSGRAVGPAYSSRLIDFINAQGEGVWRPAAAAETCTSLARAPLSLHYTPR